MAKKASASKAASKASKPSKAKAEKAKTAKKAVKKTVKKVVKKAAKKTVKKAVKSKAALKKADLKEFQQMLLDKRHELIGDMSGMEAEAMRNNRHDGTGDLSNIPTHPADLGTDNYEQEFTLGLIESERRVLGEIDEAIERILNGTFGACMGTGKPIGKTRLRARPWAKYCIEYAHLIEQGLVTPGQEEQD